jgi:hypothetical protein
VENFDQDTAVQVKKQQACDPSDSKSECDTGKRSFLHCVVHDQHFVMSINILQKSQGVPEGISPSAVVGTEVVVRKEDTEEDSKTGQAPVESEDATSMKTETGVAADSTDPGKDAESSVARLCAHLNCTLFRHLLLSHIWNVCQRVEQLEDSKAAPTRPELKKHQVIVDLDPRLLLGHGALVEILIVVGFYVESRRYDLAILLLIIFCHFYFYRRVSQIMWISLC